jgi:hypothetical protein
MRNLRQSCYLFGLFCLWTGLVGLGSGLIKGVFLVGSV